MLYFFGFMISVSVTVDIIHEAREMQAAVGYSPLTVCEISVPHTHIYPSRPILFSQMDIPSMTQNGNTVSQLRHLRTKNGSIRSRFFISA
jgi:hypothetical protein